MMIVDKYFGHRTAIKIKILGIDHVSETVRQKKSLEHMVIFNLKIAWLKNQCMGPRNLMCCIWGMCTIKWSLNPYNAEIIMFVQTMETSGFFNLKSL